MRKGKSLKKGFGKNSIGKRKKKKKKKKLEGEDTNLSFRRITNYLCRYYSLKELEHKFPLLKGRLC